MGCGASAQSSAIPPVGPSTGTTNNNSPHPGLLRKTATNIHPDTLSPAKTEAPPHSSDEELNKLLDENNIGGKSDQPAPDASGDFDIDEAARDAILKATDDVEELMAPRQHKPRGKEHHSKEHKSRSHRSHKKKEKRERGHSRNHQSRSHSPAEPAQSRARGANSELPPYSQYPGGSTPNGPSSLTPTNKADGGRVSLDSGSAAHPPRSPPAAIAEAMAAVVGGGAAAPSPSNNANTRVPKPSKPAGMRTDAKPLSNFTFDNEKFRRVNTSTHSPLAADHHSKVDSPRHVAEPEWDGENLKASTLAPEVVAMDTELAETPMTLPTADIHRAIDRGASSRVTEPAIERDLEGDGLEPEYEHMMEEILRDTADIAAE